MGETNTWPANRVAELVGSPVVGLRPLGGAGFGRPYAAKLADGRTLFVKAQQDAPVGFFTDEAAGLRWLAEVPGGARTAAVRAVDEQMLILELIDSAPATRTAAVDFGRRLAITHDGGAERFGLDHGTRIASEPLPAGDGQQTWASFYAEARLQPFLDRAVDRASISDDDRDAVQQVIAQLPDLVGPDEPPARLHGDLWSGNLLWTAETAVLIDPAAHGGHREVDLAMLQLFGAPELTSILAGYQDQHRLAPGWQDRVELYQLFPLLVHAVIFGGSYGAAAGDAAGRCLRRHRP